jgi:hypothetical protein
LTALCSALESKALIGCELRGCDVLGMRSRRWRRTLFFTSFYH